MNSFHGFNEELKRQLQDEIKSTIGHVASGGAKDFPEYRQCIGKIEGLALAERLLLDLISAAEQQD